MTRCLTIPLAVAVAALTTPLFALTIHRSFTQRAVGFGGGIGASVPVDRRLADAVDAGRAKASERIRVLVGRFTRTLTGDSAWLVTDGGSKVMVKLDGIVAPSADQPDGQESAARLKKLTAGRTVRVEFTRADANGRLLVRATIAKKDVALQLLKDGQAKVDPAVDDPPADYVAAEESARLAKRGLWRTDVK